MTYLKSGRIRNAAQLVAWQHSFWKKLLESIRSRYKNSLRHLMRSRDVEIPSMAENSGKRNPLYRKRRTRGINEAIAHSGGILARLKA
jgi:hypothetical protein